MILLGLAVTCWRVRHRWFRPAHPSRASACTPVRRQRARGRSWRGTHRPTPIRTAACPPSTCERAGAHLRPVGAAPQPRPPDPPASNNVNIAPAGQAPAARPVAPAPTAAHQRGRFPVGPSRTTTQAFPKPQLCPCTADKPSVIWKCWQPCRAVLCPRSAFRKSQAPSGEGVEWQPKYLPVWFAISS